jgi:hypothetical protein
MRRVLPVACAMLCLLGLLVVVGFAGEVKISIDVAPNVLNLSSASEVVTVHTSIPYSAVVGQTVTLNGLEISSWKSDNRGYFVAKFNSDQVKALEDIGATLVVTLLGDTVDGGSFYGTSEITVINVKKKGR